MEQYQKFRESIITNIEQGDKDTAPIYSIILGALDKGYELGCQETTQEANPIKSKIYTNANNVPTQTNESESVRAYTYLFTRTYEVDFRTVSSPNVLSKENEEEIKKEFKTLENGYDNNIRKMFGKTIETKRGQMYILGLINNRDNGGDFALEYNGLMFKEKDFDKIKPYIADFLDGNSLLSDEFEIFEKITDITRANGNSLVGKINENKIDAIGKDFSYKVELKHQNKENSTHEYSGIEEETMDILNNWNKPTMPQFNTTGNGESDPEFDGLF